MLFLVFQALPAAAENDSHAILSQVYPAEVGEIIDGTLPGAAGDLDFRLYKPKESGSRTLVCYFHGGGWVLGSQVSDDPFCRDLCDRAGVNILSVNYRHGPEDRFPAAADDASLALRLAARMTVAAAPDGTGCRKRTLSEP